MLDESYDAEAKELAAQMMQAVGENRLPTKTQARAFRQAQIEVFDPRNLCDEYKGKSVADVLEAIDLCRSELVLLCPNFIRDMNWGNVVRTANGFGVREVVFAGAKKYDRRGSVGAQNYTPIRYIPSWEEAIATYRRQGYRVVAIENNVPRKVENLYDYVFESRTLIVFGEEGLTLAPQLLDMCDDVVEIPMCGSVRSFNLATACAITLAFYNAQFHKKGVVS